MSSSNMTNVNHPIRQCVFCGNHFYGSRNARYCSSICDSSAALDRALWPTFASQLRDSGWTVSEIPMTIKRRKGFTARSPQNDQGISHFYHLSIHCPIQSLSAQEWRKADEAFALHRQNVPLPPIPESDELSPEFQGWLAEVIPEQLTDDLISTFVLCDVCGEYADGTHVQQHDGVKICLKCKLKANESAYPF